MKKVGEELVGWYGTIAIVAAYALLNFGVLGNEDLVYLLLNISGSIGIIYISMKKKAYQPAALNIVWALIAVIVLIKSLLP